MRILKKQNLWIALFFILLGTISACQNSGEYPIPMEKAQLTVI
jgi:hypothetical protein